MAVYNNLNTLGELKSAGNKQYHPSFTLLPGTIILLVREARDGYTRAYFGEVTAVRKPNSWSIDMNFEYFFEVETSVPWRDDSLYKKYYPVKKAGSFAWNKDITVYVIDTSTATGTNNTQNTANPNVGHSTGQHRSRRSQSNYQSTSSNQQQSYSRPTYAPPPPPIDPIKAAMNAEKRKAYAQQRFTMQSARSTKDEHFILLGINTDITLEEFTKVKKKVMLTWHPDRMHSSTLPAADFMLYSKKYTDAISYVDHFLKTRQLRLTQ